jgi:hypothetical protein
MTPIVYATALVSNVMFSRLRPASGETRVVVLVELNVAVSVLVVSVVDPGTMLDIQFVVVCQAPVVADELQVPLAAGARVGRVARIRSPAAVKMAARKQL